MTAFLLGVLAGVLGSVGLLLLAASRWESVTVAKAPPEVHPLAVLAQEGADRMVQRLRRDSLADGLARADNVLFAVLSNGKASWRAWRQ